MKVTLCDFWTAPYLYQNCYSSRKVSMQLSETAQYLGCGPSFRLGFGVRIRSSAKFRFGFRILNRVRNFRIMVWNSMINVDVWDSDSEFKSRFLNFRCGCGIWDSASSNFIITFYIRWFLLVLSFLVQLIVGFISVVQLDSRCRYTMPPRVRCNMWMTHSVRYFGK